MEPQNAPHVKSLYVYLIYLFTCDPVWNGYEVHFHLYCEEETGEMMVLTIRCKILPHQNNVPLNHSSQWRKRNIFQGGGGKVTFPDFSQRGMLFFFCRKIPILVYPKQISMVLKSEKEKKKVSTVLKSEEKNKICNFSFTVFLLLFSQFSLFFLPLFSR